MAETILCCVNDSSHARRAVELSTELARALERRLVFLLVNQTKPASGYPDIKSMTEEDARAVLDIAVRYARTHGVHDARPVLVEARHVPAEILRHAEETDAGHIVVGSGKPPFIGRLLLGSVSEAVVTGAACSVTVAR